MYVYIYIYIMLDVMSPAGRDSHDIVFVILALK